EVPDVIGVGFRDHQGVSVGRGVDVQERDRSVGLRDLVRGSLLGRDRTEDAVDHGRHCPLAAMRTAAMTTTMPRTTTMATILVRRGRRLYRVGMPLLIKVLGDLDGVEGGARTEVVRAAEQDQRVVAPGRLPDPARERHIAA